MLPSARGLFNVLSTWWRLPSFFFVFSCPLHCKSCIHPFPSLNSASIPSTSIYSLIYAVLCLLISHLPCVFLPVFLFWLSSSSLQEQWPDVGVDYFPLRDFIKPVFITWQCRPNALKPSLIIVLISLPLSSSAVTIWPKVGILTVYNNLLSVVNCSFIFT